MRRIAAVLVILMALPLSAPSWAQSEPEDSSRAAARKLGYDGIEAYRSGDVAIASEKLEQAYALLPVPTLALWSARALSKMGRLVEASERYLVVGTLPMPDTNQEVHEAARREAVEERALLLPRIPIVALEAEGRPRDAVTTIDGRVLPDASIGQDLPLDPGRHHIEISAAGRRTQREVVLREGQRARVRLELPVEAPPPSATPAVLVPRSTLASDETPTAQLAESFRTAGLVSVGIGGIGVALGAISGAVAIGQNADLDKVCVNDSCPPTAQHDVDSYDRTRTLSTVGFVIGAVGLTAGVVLVLLPSSAGSSSVRARVGPGSAAVSAAF